MTWGILREDGTLALDVRDLVATDPDAAQQFSRKLRDALNEHFGLKRDNVTICDKCGTTTLHFDPPLEVMERETCKATEMRGESKLYCDLPEGHATPEVHGFFEETLTTWIEGG